MDLQTKLEQLFQQNNDTIKKVKSLDELNQIRVQLLGKKGPITGVLRGMKDLSAEERPKVGAFANKIRDDLSAVIEARKAQLEQAVINAKLASETVDVTLPGDPLRLAHHILSRRLWTILKAFLWAWVTKF